MDPVGFPLLQFINPYVFPMFAQTIPRVATWFINFVPMKFYGMLQKYLPGFRAID